MKQFLSGKFINLISITIIGGVWYIVALMVNNPHLIPTPLQTLAEIQNIVIKDSFFSITGGSLLRGAIALILSAFAGAGLGFVAGINSTVNRLIQPGISIVKSTPVISVILLALIWLNPSKVPVFTGLLIMFPIIFASVSLGVSQTDPHLLEMAKVFRINPFKVFTDIYIPSILPHLIQSISTAFGIGWKAIIASEVLSQPSIAIGTEMQNSQMLLNVPGVAGWTVIALILSSAFDTLLKLAEKKLLKWRAL